MWHPPRQRKLLCSFSNDMRLLTKFVTNSLTSANEENHGGFKKSINPQAFDKRL